MVTEIRRAESDRNSNNAAIFYGYPYLTFYLEEIFCAHLWQLIMEKIICKVYFNFLTNLHLPNPTPPEV